MKNKNLYIALGIIAILGAAYFIFQRRKAEESAATPSPVPGTGGVTGVPISLPTGGLTGPTTALPATTPAGTLLPAGAGSPIPSLPTLIPSSGGDVGTISGLPVRRATSGISLGSGGGAITPVRSGSGCIDCRESFSPFL